MSTPDYPDVQEMSHGVLLGALLLGEKLLRNGTHWAGANQRDEVEKRVQELRDEWDRREALP